MPCTTILIGKKATYDGSTMIARNDDSGAGKYTPKKLTVVMPHEQPRHYRSVISHVEIDLPEDPMRYTAVPNALAGEGIWAGAGVNAANVAMTATETIASNERVLGADPLVVLRTVKTASSAENFSDFAKNAAGSAENASDLTEKATGSTEKASDFAEYTEELPGGIGEEDYPTIVLPYIHSAREGVLRTGALLEKYGTYEMNGIAFADVDEIWWMETIGGHHWIARRVPDDRYVIMPNQSGIDGFDFEDAFGEGRENLCSADMREFIEENHLNLSMDGTLQSLNPREAFGTRDDADHVYNTPRAWYMCRYFNPHLERRYGPADDDIPWSLVPEHKITVEDVKYILSSHFQGTPYDPYGSCGDASMRGAYRCIGVNRTDFLALLQLRPCVPPQICAVEWLAFGSNVFNGFVPVYANLEEVPAYFSTTQEAVGTESFYWCSRLIGALADAQYGACKIHIERYQASVASRAHEILGRYDRRITQRICDGKNSSRKYEQDDIREMIREANEALADMIRRETSHVLGKVLYETSNKMRNAYARSDA